MVDNCIAGYHSSVFAYGQTGSGKTHTMMGRLGETGSACQLASADPERGVIPRMLEHLFVAIKEVRAHPQARIAEFAVQANSAATVLENRVIPCVYLIWTMFQERVCRAVSDDSRYPFP